VSTFQPTAKSLRGNDEHAVPIAPAAVVGTITASQEDVAFRWRWIAMSVFVLSSSLNFLDRQLLAAVAPSMMAEFGLSNADYGMVIAAFSFTYMLMTPLAGLFVDRVGLRAGAMLSVGAWSLASIATGLTSTYRGLVGSRMGLGVAEAAGIPCASKATALYLPAREQGLGIAVGAVGVSIGSISAPLLVAALAPIYGWRSAFVVSGVIGLLWVPLWWFTSKRIPPSGATAAGSASVSIGDVLRDGRLWGILAANILIMAVHSMWMNWTTIYFVQVHHLTPTEANRYFAWIPPIFATLGGLTGAALVLRWVHGGRKPLDARLRMVSTMTPLLLLTAIVPLMPTPALAAGAISLSFFVVMMVLANLHVIPIDLFGPGRAAFTSSLLSCSYALIQMVLSPTMGAIADSYGFQVMCVVVSVMPLLALFIVRAAVRPTEPNPRMA
jgi:MFS transporter, ACS family, hexuronate transporter